MINTVPGAMERDADEPLGLDPEDQALQAPLIPGEFIPCTAPDPLHSILEHYRYERARQRCLMQVAVHAFRQRFRRFTQRILPCVRGGTWNAVEPGPICITPSIQDRPIRDIRWRISSLMGKKGGFRWIWAGEWPAESLPPDIILNNGVHKRDPTFTAEHFDEYRASFRGITALTNHYHALQDRMAQIMRALVPPPTQDEKLQSAMAAAYRLPPSAFPSALTQPEADSLIPRKSRSHAGAERNDDD